MRLIARFSVLNQLRIGVSVEKNNVNADHETVRFLQNAFECRSKSFLRMFGYEVFERIAGTVGGDSRAISFGSDWHAEHERARLAARLACLASDVRREQGDTALCRV